MKISNAELRKYGLRYCLDCDVDMTSRDGRASYCTSCGEARAKERGKKWRADNSESDKIYTIEYRSKKNAARRANRTVARYYEQNQRRLFPHKHRAIKARRRAAKKNATPNWVDYGAIKTVYERAAAQDKHVDHIVPLQHPRVCGLHVHWNLQLLTPSENHVKRNKFEDD